MESRANDCRPHISGFVLAGGRSSRLGQDKVLLPWNNDTLLGHAIARLQQVCDTVGVCTNRKDLGHAAAEANGLVSDAVPGVGPLGGIVAALERSETPWNLFLAVDLPLVPVEFLQALANKASNPRPADGTVCFLPQLVGLPQPLCALYHRDLTPGLRTALEAGKYKVIQALRDAIQNMSPTVDSSQAKGPILRLEQFNAKNLVSTSHLPLTVEEWFLNVNTPEDWSRVQCFGSRAGAHG